jgi:hypothetical protein
MRRTFVFLAIVVVGGCAGTPGYKVRAFGDKNGCMALASDEVLFTIVTDGRMGSGGVKAVLLKGPSYRGRILTPGGGEHVLFREANGELHIGPRSYHLMFGNLFLVSVAGESPRVKQIDLAEEEKIESVLQTDERAASFF